MALRRRRRKKADPAIDSESIRDVVRRTDANPQLVATARFLRKLIPGGEPETSEMPEPMQRLVEEVQPDGPSAMREIGKGALQAWQALSEAQRRRQGNADVAILFTDLVGFSDWALDGRRRGRPRGPAPGRRRRAEGDLLQQGRGREAAGRRSDGRLRRLRAGGLGGARRPEGHLEDRGGGLPADPARRRPPWHATQGEGRLPRRRRQHRRPRRRRAEGGEVLSPTPSARSSTAAASSSAALGAGRPGRPGGPDRLLGEFAPQSLRGESRGGEESWGGGRFFRG